jgi:hypothetical protein
MKFAEKYEIVEMLTSGRVSTFLARDRATQESVVVYTFECVSAAAELSTASIIARFCALAPNPPGIIVKAGFDEPSSAAFLTTKMPESAALQQWVGAYHSFAQKTAPVAEPRGGHVPDETAELSASELKAAMAQRNRQNPSPADDMSEGTAAFSIGPPSGPQSAGPPSAGPQPSGPPPSGGEFTRLFREANAFEPLRGRGTPVPPKTGDATDAMFGPNAGSVYPSDYQLPPPSPPAPKPAPAGTSPGLFTKEFLGVSTDRPSDRPAGGSQVAPAALPKKEPGAFTKEFLAASQSSGSTTDEAAVAPPAAIFGNALGPGASTPGTSEGQKGGAGEFTKFFGNPFDQPGTQDKSFEVPDLAASTPVKQPTGDFTKMFGRDDLPPVEERFQQPQERQTAPGSLTQLLSETGAGKDGAKLGSFVLDTNPGFRPSPPEPAPPVSPQFQQKAPAPPPPDFAPPRTAPPVVPDRPLASSTEIFRTPRVEAPPVEQVSTGPSDFTMFIDRSRLNASLPPESPPAGAGAAPPPSFTPPPLPAPPPIQFAPPPRPPMPPFPPPPALKPPVPTPPMPSAKAASYWPLITVLTVLVAIGALLVMYFVMKKH